MAKEKKDQQEEQSFSGCYGEKMTYMELNQFLEDAFESNREAELAGSDERFATCIWGHAGCVLADTEVEVRKIGDGMCHKLIVVNP